MPEYSRPLSDDIGNEMKVLFVILLQIMELEGYLGHNKTGTFQRKGLFSRFATLTYSDMAPSTSISTVS